MTGEPPETVTVNLAESDLWGVFSRKAYRPICDRSGNLRRRHDRERCRRRRERLSRLSRLEDRLCKDGEQSVPASFRQNFELHQISQFPGINEEADSAVTSGRLAPNCPFRLLEKLYEQVQELGFGMNCRGHSGSSAAEAMP